MHETVQQIFADLNIPADHTSPSLEKLASVDSRYLRDLKLNIAAVMKGNNLSRKEALLLALATAVNEHATVLIKGLESSAAAEGATDAEIAEVHACTSLMNINNVFYRFRHYLPQNQYYNNTPAGFRMNIMTNPVLGKEFFELMSLAISALNNCEMCITSHEASVKQHGASEARVYDAIRLVAAYKSLIVIL